MFLGVEKVGGQLECEVMELVAGGLARELGRHGYDNDHLGDAGGAFACLEENVGELGAVR